MMRSAIDIYLRDAAATPARYATMRRDAML